jgi:hypothetical protein
MSTAQAIERPFGISVFGSAILRVPPDIASITCSITRLEQHPKDAFRAAHEAAQIVSNFLAQAQIGEVGSSRVTLNQSFKQTGGERLFAGYTSRVTFQILLRQLDRLEEVLTGLIEAGINELGGVSMHTTRLKEFRAEMRRNAVTSAREKAENYCKAAGVALGPIIHIEDVNPEAMQGRFAGHGSELSVPQAEDEGGVRAFDPGEIVVSGAVIVAFEIGR